MKDSIGCWELLFVWAPRRDADLSLKEIFMFKKKEEEKSFFQLPNHNNHNGT